MNRAYRVTILVCAAVLTACANQAVVRNNAGLAKLRAGDCASAYSLFKLAADAGVACAKNNVGVILLHGCPAAGIAPDSFRALLKYESASASGCTVAFANAGDLYLHGMGVTQDRSKAINLYSVGARWGEPTAIGRLQSLGIDPPYPDLKERALQAQQEQNREAAEAIAQAFAAAAQGYAAGRASSNAQATTIAPAGCSSDYDCGFGNVCVKVRQNYNYYGQCYKSVDSNGNPTYPTQQATIHAINGCQMDSQCNMANGYRCVIPNGQVYGVCWKQ